jgi:hypothetical protein
MNERGSVSLIAPQYILSFLDTFRCSSMSLKVARFHSILLDSKSQRLGTSSFSKYSVDSRNCLVIVLVCKSISLLSTLIERFHMCPLKRLITRDYNVYTNSGFSLSVKSSHLCSLVHFRNMAVLNNDLLLVRKMYVFRCRSNLCLLLVLIDAVAVDECQDAEADSPAHNDRDLSRNVTRRILGSESLWAYVESA